MLWAMNWSLWPVLVLVVCLDGWGWLWSELVRDFRPVRCWLWCESIPPAAPLQTHTFLYPCG